MPHNDRSLAACLPACLPGLRPNLHWIPSVITIAFCASTTISTLRDESPSSLQLPQSSLSTTLTYILYRTTTDLDSNSYWRFFCGQLNLFPHAFFSSCFDLWRRIFSLCAAPAPGSLSRTLCCGLNYYRSAAANTPCKCRSLYLVDYPQERDTTDH